MSDSGFRGAAAAATGGALSTGYPGYSTHRPTSGDTGLGSAGLGSAGLGSAGLGSAGLGGAGATGVGPFGTGTAGVGAGGGQPIPASEVPPALRGPEEPKDEKKGVLGLSGGQVLAGALAASTSAVAASYLGVAGTVLGAGLGSVIATVSTAVYQKSIQRSNKVLQKVVTTTVGGQQVPVDEVLHAGHDSTSVAPDPNLPNAAQVGRGLPDPHLGTPHPGHAETHVMGAVPDDATRPFGVPAGGTATGRAAYGAASVPPSDASGGQFGAPPTNRPPGGTVYGGGGSWYSGLAWKRIALTSAALFVLVMSVITVAEVIEGRTVADAVNGKKGTGTTLTRPFNNNDDTGETTSPTPSVSESSEDATPSESPSDEPTPSDDVSETPSGEPSESPNPSESDGTTDESSEQPNPIQTQGGSEESTSAPVQPMDGSVSTVPSASPLG